MCAKTMDKRLFYIKLSHTIIWAFFVIIIFYVLYSGIFNRINIFTWIAISFVIIEGLVLLFFKWKCPLTLWGSKYTQDTEPGFDIFIPKWLAINNKLIFTSLFMAGLIIVSVRSIFG